MGSVLRCLVGSVFVFALAAVFHMLEAHIIVLAMLFGVLLGDLLNRTGVQSRLLSAIGLRARRNTNGNVGPD